MQDEFAVTVLDEQAQWLNGRQRNVTSQFGEDGLIEAVFEKIGTTNRWCFEVGASDGLLYSNTKRLRDEGWYALLIEADARLFGECQIQESPAVKAVHAKLGDKCGLDDLLAAYGAPLRLDFGSIDIDGQDWHVWRDLERFRPRVVLVEYAYFNPPDYIPPLEASELNEQAGLQAIIDLGTEKGYAAIVKTYCNVLFVDQQIWDGQ